MNHWPDDARLVAAVRDAVPGTQAIWLFGSAARGQLRATSDVDIAVWHDEPLDAVGRFEAAQKIAATIDRDVDLLDFLRVSTVMQAQILGTGRRLFTVNPGRQAEMVARIARDYQDMQRWRRPAIRQLSARLSGGAA